MSVETLKKLRETIKDLSGGKPYNAWHRGVLEATEKELESMQIDHFVPSPDPHEVPEGSGWVDVQEHIRIHLIAMPTDRGPRGWLSTYGMRELGYAELEIRDVPMFLFAAAGSLLNSVCSYMVNGTKPVLEGQTMQEGSRLCVFQFKQLEPIRPDQAGHYKHPRWCLIDPPGIECRCDVCSGKVPSA